MELDKFKTSWKNQPESDKKVTAADLYKMKRNKSSSIVKWIFVLGIAELLFWSGLNFIIPKQTFKIYQEFNLENILKYSALLHYVVAAFFLILFYRNYKAISVTDGTKQLMHKILRVRKTVKFYVYYNIAGFLAGTIIVNFIMFSNPATLLKVINPENKDIDASAMLTTTFIIQLIMVFVMLGLLWLFYRYTYGTLLKKLSKNYKELNHLEQLN